MADKDRGGPQADALLQVKRSAAALIARLKPLASLNLKGPAADSSLSKAIEAIGDLNTFQTALADTVAQATGEAERARSSRLARFNAAIAEFQRDQPADRTRETAVGWRVGAVELERRAEDGSLRALYNREPVTAWGAVRTREDVEELVTKAEAALGRSRWPTDALGISFAEAFAAVESSEFPSAQRGRVALRDLLVEVRVVHFRRAVRHNRSREAKAAAEMPLWAVLYNTDLYRSVMAQLPPEQRLTFETGGQRETARLGVVLNGLDPKRQYETYCYVRRGRS